MFPQVIYSIAWLAAQSKEIFPTVSLECFHILSFLSCTRTRTVLVVRQSCWEDPDSNVLFPGNQVQEHDPGAEFGLHPFIMRKKNFFSTYFFFLNFGNYAETEDWESRGLDPETSWLRGYMVADFAASNKGVYRRMSWLSQVILPPREGSSEVPGAVVHVRARESPCRGAWVPMRLCVNKCSTQAIHVLGGH